MGGGQVQGWMLGKVTAITGDLLQVEFTESSADFDKVVDRWSTRVAQPGSKTGEDYEWRRQNLNNAVDYVVDAWDGTDWLEATIFETKAEEVAPGRVVEFAWVAFRVYRETGKRMRKDTRGTYDGWSAKFDEWMPIYTNLIVPHRTKSQGNKASAKDQEDEELDSVIQPSFGFERVYAVPRIYSCLSKRFLYQLDKFGNAGGFEELLAVMETHPLEDKNLSLTSLGYMITLISMPSKLWHKQFIEQYGARFCAAIIKRFLESDDAKIRDLDQACSCQAIIATEMIQSRIMPRPQARKAMELFKLQFIKLCLSSQFLEKRI